MIFKVNVRRVEDHTFILNLEGRLTADTSSAFHKALVPILQKQPKAISINLTQVSTMDEAGIAMLMNGLMGISNQGIYFYLIGLPEQIKEYYQARLDAFGPSLFSMTTH